MKISTKGRYGIRLMLSLALHYDKGTLALKSIAREQDISEKYLEQIINPLTGRFPFSRRLCGQPHVP